VPMSLSYTTPRPPKEGESGRLLLDDQTGGAEGPDRTRWSTHSGSSRRIMVLTVRMGTEGQQWERNLCARLPPREGV
jgi:hypothetical protein